MIKKAGSSVALCLALVSTSTFAGDMGSTSLQTSNIPNKGIFIGLGGSYNSVIGDRTINISGASEITQGTDIIATGSTRGPDVRFNNTQSTFAPEAQVGYFNHFTNREQLWGMKFIYRYLGLSSENQNVTIPQVGTFSSLSPGNNSFTGDISISSSELNVNHELVFIPFIGQSFRNGFVYLGVGPSLFRTQINNYGMSGSAIIEGFPIGFANVPNSSSTAWIWGGVAELGMTYYIGQTWMLDFSYSYAITGNFKNDTSKPFSTGFDTIDTFGGTVSTNISQHITAQTFKISVNKVFSL